MPEPPCEVCGKLVTYDEDDQYEDDLYRVARPGNRAYKRGHRFRRICGRCRTERPEEVAAVVKKENATKL